MGPLETLLRSVTSMINRQIGAKTPARALCSALSDRVMALRVRNTALAIYLVAADDELIVSTAYEEDPDVVVSGSLIALTRLMGPGGDTAIRAGDIELSGDVLVAQQFQKLLQYGRPDMEEELSAILGDSAAHGIGEFVRGAGNWAREARRTMRQNIGEYLQEESHAVPTRDDVQEFRSRVDELRDDVARFEARLDAVESQSSSQDNA